MTLQLRCDDIRAIILKPRILEAQTVSAHHILTFAQWWRGGGVERVQLRLAQGWLEEGRRVTMVIGEADGALAAEAPAGLEVIELGSTSMVKLTTALPGIVRKQRPDVIFCPGNYYTGTAAWLRLRLGRDCPPIVAKVSNALARRDQNALVALGYRRWLAWHRHFLHHVVAMTPAMQDEAARAMHMPHESIAVIANPPTRAIAGAALPPLPDGPFLLGAGRLEPQKRWDRLIAAMPQLERQDVSLVILGDGTSRADLEAQIAALDLQHRVTLPGHVTDPLIVIARAEAVALVSDFEGVPNVLREALSLGVPVISTDSSVAVREIVTAPELGTVIAPDDHAALVAALNHWLTPGQPRPAPVPQPGEQATRDYLALFDALTEARA